MKESEDAFGRALLDWVGWRGRGLSVLAARYMEADGGRYVAVLEKD